MNSEALAVIQSIRTQTRSGLVGLVSDDELAKKVETILVEELCARSVKAIGEFGSRYHPASTLLERAGACIATLDVLRLHCHEIVLNHKLMNPVKVEETVEDE